MIDAPYVCEAPRIVDGDSIRCGKLRLRLLGIDAPEMGKCPRQRVCVQGSGSASKASLARAVRLGTVRYRSIKLDRYGRTIAVVHAGSVNLSCYQIRAGQAAYVGKWDDGGLVRRACR
ncbi:MAG: thermonuclease family protein [Pseudomonadota bacterium]